HDIDSVAGDRSYKLHANEQLLERAPPDGLIGIANAVHAHPDEIDDASKRLGHRFVDMVTVCREGHRELRLVCSVVAQFDESRIESRFAATEPNAECAMRIQLVEPASNTLVWKHITGLRRIAMIAGQITSIGQGDRHLTRGARPERSWNGNLIE